MYRGQLDTLNGVKNQELDYFGVDLRDYLRPGIIEETYLISL
jgi:hypothetical protein